MILDTLKTPARPVRYNGAVVWNNLPYEAKVAGSLSCFQRIINQANT